MLNKEEVKEMNIKQLGLYIHSLNKYDEEVVIIPMLEHITKNKLTTYLRLRPSGIDAVQQGELSLEELEKKYYMFQSEWIKILRNDKQ